MYFQYQGLATLSVSILFQVITVLGTPRPLLSNETSSFGSVANQSYTTPDSGFPFIIPWENDQSCNIFGALCQPGSISVQSMDSNLHSSEVQIPCSSYLSAQSSFIRTGSAASRSSWLQDFGRNTECHSFASMYSQSASTSPWTFSDCPASPTGTVDPNNNGIPTQVPANPIFPRDSPCCGLCGVIFPEVRLYYFPDPNAAAYCAAQNRTRVIFDPDAASNSTGGVKRRVPQNASRPTTTQDFLTSTVISGFTMVSPTMYLEMLGTFSMTDDCGPIGSPLTSAFVAVPSGGLKTEEVDHNVIGDVVVGQWAMSPLTEAIKKPWSSGDPLFWTRPFTYKSLNLAELDCPTAGVGSTVYGTLTYTTIGPPWLPYIVPPTDQLANLNPECNRVCSGRFPNEIIGSFDPPRALVQDPMPLIPHDQGDAVQTPSPSPPTIIAGPKAQTGAQLVPPGPSPTQVDLDTSVPSNVNKLYDLASPSAPMADLLPTASSQPEVSGNWNLPVSAGDASAADSHTSDQTANDGQHPNQGASNPGSNSASYIQQLNNALANSANPTNEHPAEENVDGTNPNAAPPLNVDDQTFTPASSGFIVDGQTVQPGRPAATVDNAPISLDPSEALFVGTQVIPQTAYLTRLNTTANQGPSPPTIPDIPPVTVTGQVFTPAATGFAVNDQMIQPGSPAVTIASTPISLDPSGTLHIGTSIVHLTISQTLLSPGPSGILHDSSSSAISLLLPSSPSPSLLPSFQPPILFTIADQTITAMPTGFVVGGQSVVPGGSAVVYDGVAIPMRTDGEVVLGGSTTADLRSVQGTATTTSDLASGSTISVQAFRSGNRSGSAKKGLSLAKILVFSTLVCIYLIMS